MNRGRRGEEISSTSEDFTTFINLLKESKAQEQDAPNDAWVKFNLYRSAAENKEGNAALDYLAEAVTLDPLYALEYQELSKMAYEKGRPDEAFRMLTLASEAFPQDPFIKLQMVQLAHEIGEKEAALHLLNQLRNLQWSDCYYPQMSGYLVGLTSFVQSGEVSTGQAAIGDKEGEPSLALIIPDEDTSRQRVMHSN